MSEAAPQPSHGTPCWVSLMARDLSGSQDFYGELFGWEFHQGAQQLGPHLRAQLGEMAVAGLGEIHSAPGLPVAWTPYLAVDDADSACTLIRDCGGTVGVGPLDSEWGGRVAIASDPAGATFGVWQTDGQPGVAPDGRPGSCVWNELLVPESAQVTTFYSAVFGHEVEQMGPAEVDYHTLLVRGSPVCGVRGVGEALPRERGALWVTYFAVENVDNAIRMVKKAGGTVIRDAHDSAYGRYARVTDPEGAPFVVIELTDPRDAVERPLRTLRA